MVVKYFETKFRLRYLQTVRMWNSEDCFWYDDHTRDISVSAHYTEYPGNFTSVTLIIKGNVRNPDNTATLGGAGRKELAFLQWFCWRLKSSGMWCCVTGWVVLFISAHYSALNFRVRFVECGSEINCAYLLTSSFLCCHGPRCLLVCAHNALMCLTANV